MTAQRGLTLIELMIALAVLAILCGFVVNSATSALEASRAAGVRADLLDSLRLAGVRAGIAGTRAVLCPSVDGLRCSDDPDWSRGWLVFMDPNANREMEGGERLLRRQAPLPGRVRLRSTGGRVRIVFQGNAGNAGSNVTFTLCDGRGPSRARTLVLNNSGGLRDGVATAEALEAACVR